MCLGTSLLQEEKIIPYLNLNKNLLFGGFFKLKFKLKREFARDWNKRFNYIWLLEIHSQHIEGNCNISSPGNGRNLLLLSFMCSRF